MSITSNYTGDNDYSKNGDLKEKNQVNLPKNASNLPTSWQK